MQVLSVIMLGAQYAGSIGNIEILYFYGYQ